MVYMLEFGSFWLDLAPLEVFGFTAWDETHCVYEVQIFELLEAEEVHFYRFDNKPVTERCWSHHFLKLGD